MRPLSTDRSDMTSATAPTQPRRRQFLWQSGWLLALSSLSSVGWQRLHAQTIEPLEVSEGIWRQWLSDAEYEVLRREGTERAGSSPLDGIDEAGIYVCAGCFLPLFSSEHKYDSGTGWPSFWRPINDEHINTKKDFKLIWPRTEYHCARCQGHQGHVFGDGPDPTGQRWCNNGVALRFVPEGQSLPALRQAPAG